LNPRWTALQAAALPSLATSSHIQQKTGAESALQRRSLIEIYVLGAHGEQLEEQLDDDELHETVVLIVLMRSSFQCGFK
jgi:hypothetical protein